MDEVERRASTRRDIKFPVSFTIEATSLKGETVNVGDDGVLVHAEGRVAVLCPLQRERISRPGWSGRPPGRARWRRTPLHLIKP